MTFTSRQISVSFSMANGSFEGGGNTATLTGLRISARIDGPGGLTGMTLSMAIFGMPLSMMNQLATVGRQIGYIGKNQITVMAGDAVSGMQLVFQGIITFAYTDGQSQPNVCFRVEAAPGALANVTPMAPTSIKGTGDAAEMLQKMAQQGGFSFENNGVKVKLSNPYISGSIGAQIKNLAQSAGIEHIIDRGTLAIWNPGSVRSASTVSIAPPTMVGYPAFNQAAVVVKTVFNPGIVNGAKINIQSDITPACGDWSVIHVTHEIESMMPRGKWFTLLQAVQIGSNVTPGGQ
jgi:hypothetical protein